MLKFFDVHTHTQFPQYNEDRDLVILRSLEAGVWMLQVGTDFLSSKKAVELAEKYKEGVYASVGLHPNDVAKEKFNYEEYKKLALSSKKVVAIGECGLDYYRTKMEGGWDKQKEIFKKHIELAKNVKKPLMIHCREAFHDLTQILQESVVTAPRAPFLNKEGGDEEMKSLSGERFSSPGIIHFFSGNIDDAQKLLDLGFSFSFGGVITFTRDYDEQIKFIPLNKILLETDAPYVAPIPYRGKRNEPFYVIEVAKKIAEIKGATVEEVAQMTTQNTLQLFMISKT